MQRTLSIVVSALALGALLAACNPFGGGGGAAAGPSLTGEQATARFAAKGYQWMMQPNVIAAGNAKTTTFMTPPPNTMTIMVMEYNPMFAQAAFNAMKGTDPNACQLFGSTIVQITGGTPELRAKAMLDVSTP
jgi:hypothetical protein